MGLMDDAKKLAAKGKALAAEHESTVDRALDGATRAVDQRTGGKHSAHLAKGRDAVDRFLDGERRPDATDRTTDRTDGTDGPGTDGTPRRP